jgi:hypothetical protein
MTFQRYFVGLDLGQVSDYTALAVLHRDIGTIPRGARGLRDLPQPAYSLPHLERFSLGTKYTEIVKKVVSMLQQDPFKTSRTSLVIDATGVGRPVVDLFRTFFPTGIAPVTITAGSAVSQDAEGYWHVPKKELVSALQVLLQGRRLKIAKGLAEASVLVREFENFKVKVTASAHETFESWREGDSDDLVLAVALASWAGELSLWHERAEAQDETWAERVVLR